MKLTFRKGPGLVLAAALLGASPACTHSDWEAIAAGLEMAAEEMSVTLTMVPVHGCGYNANGYAVCDDTGDGYADRYAEPGWDYIPGYVTVPPVRVNDYGEAFQYDAGCDCWQREPSLDTYPQ